MKLIATAGGLAIGIVAYLVGLVAGQPEIAAAGILAVWAVRQIGASRWSGDNDVRWGRVQKYIWRSNRGMQYALRAMALLLLLVEADVFSIGLFRLAALASIATLTACYLLPALSASAFSLQMDAIGLPGFESAGTRLRLFDGTNARFRDILALLRVPVRWLEPVVLLALVLGGADVDDLLEILFGLQLCLAGLSILVALITSARDVLGKNFERREHNLVEQLGEFQPEVVLYFSASAPESLYQPAQWLGALQATKRRLVIITRELALLEPLAESSECPVVWVRDLSDLERVVPTSARLGCYVNNGVKNGHFLRLDRLVHIQLLHGESDKGASTAKTTRAFDRVFVAGQAAIDRYVAAGTGIPPERFAIVGRPVTDAIDVLDETRSQQTVFYAPTWEGFDDASNWSSLGEISRAVLAELRRRDELTVIFKPHPLTGDTDPRYLQTLQEVKNFVEADPRGMDRYLEPDSDADLYELFNQSDCLITDLSSVLADYLRSAKPIIVADPKALGAAGMREGFPTTVGSYVASADPLTISAALDAALGPDPLSDERLATAAYVLGDFGGSSTERFVDVVEAIFTETEPADPVSR
jgi:hypothetical protein